MAAKSFFLARYTGSAYWRSGYFRALSLLISVGTGTVEVAAILIPGTKLAKHWQAGAEKTRQLVPGAEQTKIRM